MTNWIKHDSNEPPALAPAALVELYSSHFRQVSWVDWKPGQKYIVFTDPEGVTYCSSDGLEPWAEYVATNPDGRPIQFPEKPFHSWIAWTRPENGVMTNFVAPPAHRHPGHWKDSLMRVWREE